MNTYTEKEAEAIKFVNSLLNIGILFMAYNEKKCYLCAFKKVLCNKGYTVEEVYHNTCDNGVMITW